MKLTSQFGETLITFSNGRSPLNRMRVLIVDDEEVNVALLEEVLGAEGYTRMKCVTDSRNALAACKEFAPDIVLLDLMMPYIDGFAVLEALRSAPAEVFLPIIVLTADSNDETKLRALNAGATDFLLKPFADIEVLLRVRNLLEMRQLHLQLDARRGALEEALHASNGELRQAQAELDRVRP
ncbi:MAG TPA: response regulator [Chthoniobacterales bacterium]|jgi:putative two-component system response regulator